MRSRSASRTARSRSSAAARRTSADFGRHFRHGGPGFGPGKGFGGPGIAAGVEEVATYLGLKPEELRTQLMSGKSLADIAKAQGKTVDGLKAAITDAVTKRLDAAVTAGKITTEQKAKLLDGLSAHLDDFVNGVHKARGFRPRHWNGDEKPPPFRPTRPRPTRPRGRPRRPPPDRRRT